MAQIGNIAVSGTGIFNLDFLPEKILFNSSDDPTQLLSNFSVVTSGTQLMSITNVARLTALAKFDSGAILSDPAIGISTTASYLRLATGRINKASTITGTNGSAVIPIDVFAASTNIGNVARRAVEQSINASANATFDNFECIIFSTANVLRAQITFANGFTDEYTPGELRALYANYHITDTGGNLEGLTVIAADSGAGLIAQVVLFCSAGGITVVLKSDYVAL